MRFFCTAGRGTEIFAAQEIRQTLSLKENEVSVCDGRVYFNGNLQQINDILSLKSVERAFVLVLYKNSQTFQDLDRRSFLNQLRSTILNEHWWKDNNLESTIDHLCLKEDKKRQSNLADNFEINPADDTGPSPNKKKCVEKNPVLFRVSCKCTGNLGRKVSPQLLAKQIGIQLCKKMKWKVDFKSPAIEICIHLNDDYLNIGIPLTRYPLSKRSYIKYHGLRGTVAWIMADLADIKKDSVLLDPMCGKASILVEAAVKNKDAFCIGCDISLDQIKQAEDNITSCRAHSHTEIMRCDARGLPFPAGFADGIVCDCPFGKKFCTEIPLQTFHQQLLQEIHRVLKKGKKVVVLVSEEIKVYISHMYKKMDNDVVLRKKDDVKSSETKDILPESSNSQSGIQTQPPEKPVCSQKCDKELTNCLQKYDSEQTSFIPKCETEQTGCSPKSDTEQMRCSQRKFQTEQADCSLNCVTERTNSSQKQDKDIFSSSQKFSSEIQVEQNDCVLFEYVCDHYIKLGETDSYIVVLKKM